VEVAMDSRERVRTALTGGAPDKIPRAMAFFQQSLTQLGQADPDAVLGLDVRIADFEPPPGQDDFLTYLEGLPPDVHVGSLAQLHTYHAWNYHPEREIAGPLEGVRKAEEIAEYVLDRLRTRPMPDGLAAQVAVWHGQGLAVAGGPPHLGGELFESAYRLRGFGNFLADLILRRPLANYLLDQLAAVIGDNVVALVQSGVDILLLDDDVAMPTGLIISPSTWREFFRPRMEHIIRTAHEVDPDVIIFYHSDGNFTDIVRDLVDIGVQVINPVAPDCMNAATIRAEFGNRLAFWGTLGSATLWDRGTPEQIRAEVRLRIATLGRSGLMLAPAYDADYIPAANLWAFAEACDEFGRAGSG